MTTAIIDVKNRMIYADDQQTELSSVHKTRGILGFKGELVGPIVDFTPIEKIRMGKEGHFIVGAGSVKTVRQFSANYPNNLPSAPSICTTIVACKMVGETLRVVRFRAKQGLFSNRWVVETINTSNTQFIVIGSGEDFARGALAAGCTPEEAIKAASLCDTYTSANVSKRKIVDVYESERIANAEEAEKTA